MGGEVPRQGQGLAERVRRLPRGQVPGKRSGSEAKRPWLSVFVLFRYIARSRSLPSASRLGLSSHLTRYRPQQEDTFYWCLNPNSGDTGGLLGDDWTTPDEGKLALLARVQPDPSAVHRQGSQVCVAPGSYANAACSKRR